MYIDVMFNKRCELYGESVFSSFRAINGRVLSIDAHYQRLFDSCLYCFGPVFKDLDEFIKFLSIDIRLEKLLENFPNNYFRLTVYLDAPISLNLFKFKKEMFKLDIKCVELREKKEALKVCSRFYPFSQDYIPIKSGSYTHQLAIKRNSQLLGFDDVLFIDKGERLLELSTSSLLFQTFEDEYLSSFESYILKGTTISHLREKIKIKNSKLTLNDLTKIKHIYSLNAVNLITPIIKINDREFEIGDISNLKEALGK